MKHDVLAQEWFYDLLTRPNIAVGGFCPQHLLKIQEEKGDWI